MSHLRNREVSIPPQDLTEGRIKMQASFRQHAKACRHLGSPFTARLCDLFADRPLPDGPVAQRLERWPGDANVTGDAVPLRLAGALHALVLAERDPGLATVYPPYHEEADDEALWQALHNAVDRHADFIAKRLDSPPQTNEVRRSAALLPGFMTVASLTGLPKP